MNPKMVADLSAEVSSEVSAEIRMEIKAELVSIAGSDNVTLHTAGRPEEFTSRLSVAPASAQQVAEVLRFAESRKLAVVPTGGGTKQGFGLMPSADAILLDMRRMNQVQFYDPGDLTCGFGAGTTIAEIDALLAPHKQWLPLDVAMPRHATIGGALATNSQGPLKAGFGGLRDFCIGIEFVTAGGKIAKGGGRVVKNVAGYDMMKLMIGSFGTLAVITGANFKLFPRPQRLHSYGVDFESLDDCMRSRDALLASPLFPPACEVVSPEAHEYLRGPVEARDPDDYSPAAPLDDLARPKWTILLRAQGSDAVLARYRRELEGATGGNAIREYSGVEEAQLWSHVSDFAETFSAHHRNAMVVRVSLPLASVRAALQAAQHSGAENNMLCAASGSATAGALTLCFAPLPVDPPSAVQYASTVSALRSALPADASAVVARCPAGAKSHFNVWGGISTDLAQMRAIKGALDPENILNRGRSMF